MKIYFTQTFKKKDPIIKSDIHPRVMENKLFLTYKDTPLLTKERKLAFLTLDVDWDVMLGTQGIDEGGPRCKGGVDMLDGDISKN